MKVRIYYKKYDDPDITDYSQSRARGQYFGFTFSILLFLLLLLFTIAMFTWLVLLATILSLVGPYYFLSIYPRHTERNILKMLAAPPKKPGIPYTKEEKEKQERIANIAITAIVLLIVMLILLLFLC